MTDNADVVRSIVENFGKKITATTNEEWSRERKQSEERFMLFETQIEELFEEIHQHNAWFMSLPSGSMTNLR